jgi:NADH-quinone oxidoreductase subunit D
MNGNQAASAARIPDEIKQDSLLINMGPSHPAMHGTVRMLVALDGETVRDLDIEVGFLHRGFEKMAEAGTWTEAIPYTDRLNYVSPLINNVGYAGVVEKLLDIEITERCKYVRVFVSEISRIADHLTAVGAMSLELGGFTPFLWAIQAREELYFLIEFITGARVTTAYTRVGGLRWDLPEGWQERYLAAEKKVLRLMADIEALLTRNRVFIDRCVDVGTIGPDEAKAWGFTGPCLRASGVDYDVRKHAPYLVYDRLDFEVPIGHKGDNYDRYLVRLEEIRQSVRILRQVVRDIPDGPVNVDDWRVVLPPKDAVYNTIEGMIAHFELIMKGIQVPPGEAYYAVEGGNGEVGFYAVSDGSGYPYRLHVRPPCFALMQGLKDMVVGGLIADIIPTFDSINMIGGEIDR